MNQHVLVTGGAGFIGSHVVEKLLAENYRVTVIDNFDPFYNVEIKKKNISSFINHPEVRFYELDIQNEAALYSLLTETYDAIIHLAAKAGVRPSIDNPVAYQEVNVKGTQNLLEFARKKNIKQFVFGSSSSVYGINTNIPWDENEGQLKPISPYASSKISGELLGHVYSYLYGIRFIGLRFFTVFGPRQRPDLAIHSFVKKIMNSEPINIYGDGSTKRDYTYVGDIVDGVFNALQYKDSEFEIINLGNHRTVTLFELIQTIETVFEKKAIIQPMPEQPGDVPVTYANIEKARNLLSYNPKTTLETGLIAFKNWIINN